MRLTMLGRVLMIGAFLLCASVIVNAQSLSQKFVIGGKLGLSVGGGTAGLQIGPTGKYFFNNNMGVSSDLNINTQTGTPVEWNASFNYMLDVPNQNYRPYFDGGMSLWFITGGPYFGLRFGGGVDFKVAPNMYIPADVQLGPVFGGGSAAFYFAITTGIRYVIP